MKLVKDGYLACINCGQVYDYLTADEHVDFYENRHKIRKKSVHHIKYHIMNVMNAIAQKNNIQIGYYNREKILRIFRLINQNSPEVNVGRKRMISVNFILKQLFDILGIEYKFIPLTKSIMESSSMFNSIRKSFLSNEPPLRAVLRSSNTFW